MVPSRPPTPVGGGGAQSAGPSLMRANSGFLGGQPGSIAPQQQPFSSMASPRTQFGGNSGNGVGLLGNFSNVSSLLSHSFVNGGMVSGGGLSGAQVGLQQRGGVGGAADMIGSGESHPQSFNSSSGPTQGQQFQSQSASQENSTQARLFDGAQNFQQQFSLHHNQQQQQYQHQHQHQQLQGGLGNGGMMGPVKLEPQTAPTDQNGPSHQLASMHSLGPAKIEPRQLQSLQGLGPVKLERQHSDSSLFLQQQQQQQQFLQMSRQSSQAAAAAQMNLLHQQRIMQLQQQQHQQQQQQTLKTLPQQRTQLQQQLQQGLPVRTQGKPTTYEPGICARRLTQYLYHQQHRPEDNNIEFWRKFVAEYFASNAKKRWCVSLYGSGRQTTGVFPQLTLRRVMDTAKQVTKSGNLNEFSMVLLNNVLSLPLGLLLIFTFNEAEYLSRTPLLKMPTFWFVITLSGFLGLAISFTSMWFLHQTGATTYSLVGSLNKIPLSLIGILLFKVPTSLENFFSILFGLLAGVFFAKAKIRERSQ